MLRLNDGVPELAGPCGPEPWYLEVGPDEDPVEVVSRLSANLLGPPLLAHSTSWRRGRGGVILSFIVVIADGQAPDFEGVPIGRAELARNSATEAARSIAAAQVIEHGLRHLSWLAKEDQVVKGVLSDEWKRLLEGYVPEPFQHV
ncbi:MAG: hypothetical protein E6I69_10105 [Chloroflexi bacterium]|nr:MAG: hypothetical protein E6I69_10105 [Chloroflexota bacterium]TME90657.1 MAG: hypothetical protein E6I34_12835 [Chloroflexota bacterium]